ncbi:MAG: hypothetical protein JW760_08415 [Spirochaetales bacterium]|nr:hypothetical protein [Spirochaetales bacterium]
MKKTGEETWVTPRKRTLMFKTARRRYGQVQPGIKMGPFILRLPLVHHPLELSELFQGIIMTATGLGLVALLEDLFGIPYEAALTIIIVQQLGYYLHQFLGDTTISGWLTPAVPLIMTFIARYPAGPERLQAYIALQLVVGLIFIIFGLSGMANKMMKIVPESLKAGLIIGAALSVLMGEYGITPAGLLFKDYFYVLVIGVPLVLFLIYSDRVSSRIKERPSGFLAKLSRYGIVPSLLLVMFLAFVTGEAKLTGIQFGFFLPQFGHVIREWSLFSLGMPKLEMFVSSVPIALAAYIMAFGETVLAAETVEDAAKCRPDEEIGFSTGRLNLITGIRNIIHALIAPNGGLAGPNWAAMTMVIARRYEQGKDSMYTLIGGAASFNIMRVIMMTFLPLVTFILPFRVPILCILMVLQGFAGFSLGFKIANDRMKRTVAGLIGVVLAFYGASWAILVGIFLSLTMEHRPAKNPLKNNPESVGGAE